MKKICGFLVLLFGFVSCTTNDDYIKYHPELLPIESVTLPTEFVRDNIYEIPFEYIRPTTCHVFEGFYYEKEANVRTIAIETSVIEQSGCTVATVNPITEILYFRPTLEDSYIFKIWKGKDSNGQNIFEEIEIPVVP
ncbi:MAG: hypothetical protein V4670_06830 [Bacteroidota bacterium]